MQEYFVRRGVRGRRSKVLEDGCTLLGVALLAGSERLTKNLLGLFSGVVHLWPDEAINQYGHVLVTL